MTMDDVIEFLLGRYKNLVFLGEAGSGKTETALSIAEAAARVISRRVHFFDMDQTKPLFRARDAAETLESGGVEFHFQSQYLDAPTVAPGVAEALTDGNAFVLMDVGGGAQGCRMIGQFAHILNRDDSCALYLVNPYRPWSGCAVDAAETLRRISAQSRIERVSLAANPNTGPDTTEQEVICGLGRVRSLFPGETVRFVCALERLAPALSGRLDVPVLPVRLHTLPDWF